MTKKNYTQFTNTELVQVVDDFNVGKSNIERFLKSRHIALYNEIVSRTSNLDNEIERVLFTQRLFFLRNGLHDIPICKRDGCFNRVKWNKSLGRFNQHCSRKCSALDKDVQAKTEQTNLKNLGVKRPLQSKVCLTKANQTNLRIRGVKYPAQSEDVKNKIKRTNLDAIGVEYVFQLDQFRETSKETNMRKRGVEYSSQSKTVKQKIRNSQTKLYGGIGFASKVLAQKVRDKVIEHYGVDHPMRSEEIKQKVKERCREKYGYDYYQQTPQFHLVVKKSYTNPKYPDVKFNTLWEFKVYDFLTEHNIRFEYQPSISIPYEYADRVFTYHPDFIVEGNRIVEVKGDHFFRINKITGKEEMYCPFRYPNWSDERYEWECGKYEAKHQCMLRNNVIILRGADIKNLRQDKFMGTLQMNEIVV